MSVLKSKREESRCWYTDELDDAPGLTCLIFLFLAILGVIADLLKSTFSHRQKEGRA